MKMSSPSLCKGVIFDLDNTLIPTLQLDVVAVSNAISLAFELDHSLTQTNSAKATIAARFKALLSAESFPTSIHCVSVAAWRVSLWARALWPADPSLNEVLACLLEGSGSSDLHVLKLTQVAQAVKCSWCKSRLEHFQFPPPVRDLLKRLVTSGLEIAILTNGHRDVQAPKLLKCCAGELFGACTVIACNLHDGPREKPDVSSFEAAAASMGCALSETVMVGDSWKNDIEGGNQAGCLATVLVSHCPYVDISSAERRAVQMVPAASANEISFSSRVHRARPTFAVESVLDLERAIRKCELAALTREGSFIPTRRFNLEALPKARL